MRDGYVFGVSGWEIWEKGKMIAIESSEDRAKHYGKLFGTRNKICVSKREKQK